MEKVKELANYGMKIGYLDAYDNVDNPILTISGLDSIWELGHRLGVYGYDRGYCGYGFAFGVKK